MTCGLSCDSDPSSQCAFPGGGLGEPFAASVTAILEEERVPLRVRCLAEFLETAPPAESAEMKAVIGTHWLDLEAASLTLLLSEWAEQDPRAAFEDALARRGGERVLGIETVVREWAVRQPQEAIRAVIEQLEGRDEDRQIAALAVIAGWQEANSELNRELLALVEGLPLSKPRNIAIDAMNSIFLRRFGTDAAIELVESTPEEGVRNFRLQVLRRFAGELSRTDPERAVEWSSLHADGPFGRNMRRHIGMRWGWFDGPSAMEWVRTLEPGREREDVVERSFGAWVQRDREAAVEWMRTRTDQPELEPALETFLTVWGRKEPSQALALLPLMRLENERRLVIERTVKDWASKDPEAAMSWLENAEIPEDIRRRLLREHS